MGKQIVDCEPASLSAAGAASLPLIATTAWRMLFDRLDVRKLVPGATHAILVTDHAGSVGSVAIQLARCPTDLAIIATASRPEMRDWVFSLGAHTIADHSRPLAAQITALGLEAGFLQDRNEQIQPQAHFGLIDDRAKFSASVLKRKSVSIHQELMHTRPIYGTADMTEQGKLLTGIVRLVDACRLHTTRPKRMSPVNAVNLKRAHAVIESCTARGKAV